jgi:hypothetical protein
VPDWSLFVQGHTLMLTGVSVTFGPGPPPVTRLWVSPDGGASWQRSTANLQIVTVVPGADGILALARNPANFQSGLWTSSDGLSWKQVPDDAGTFRSATITALVKGGPGWVAGGSAGGGTTPPSQAIWTSADGRTWTRADLASSQGSQVTILVANGEKVIALASSPNGTSVLASQDGLHWQQAKDSPPGIYSYGNPTIAPLSGGFVGLLDEGGETAVWSSPDGLSWTRIGSDDLFGGTARVSNVISYRGSLAAIGTFAPHPRPSCLSRQGADQTDLRVFQSAIFLWSPNGSAQPQAAVNASDPQGSKLLPSDFGQRLNTNNVYSYRSSYLNFCADTSLLGKHIAYQLAFPLTWQQSGSPPGVQGQALTIVAADTAHAQSAFRHASSWMFAGARPRAVRPRVHLGDETQAYSFNLPSDIAPTGITYKAYVVMWRRGATIGGVFTLDLSLSGSLAQKQYQRYESRLDATRSER